MSHFIKHIEKPAVRGIIIILLSVLSVSGVVYGASTISTNIQTDGTLSVTGLGHFTVDLNIYGGDLNLGTGSATSTLTSSGARLGLASTSPWGLFSVESVAGTVGASNPIFVVGDQGTSTPFFLISGNDGRVGIGTSSPGVKLGIAGDINANIIYGDTLFATSTAATSTLRGGLTVDTNTLVVDYSSNRVGVASTAPFVALGVTGTTTSSAGAILGLNGAPVNQLRFGTCTLNPGFIQASSTLVVSCTGATGVTATDNIFITATKLEYGLSLVSASSTADDAISIAVHNNANASTSGTFGSGIDPISTSVYWMGIR